MLNTSSMLNTMSEAQRRVLQAAAARGDHLLQPPANARSAAAKAMAGRLIDGEWAKKVRAPKDAPVWRRDAASGSAFALKLTAKGLKAITASIEKAAGAGEAAPRKVAENAGRATPSSKGDALPAAPIAASNDALRAVSAARPLALAPRGGSKLDRVLGVLSADAGATIADLVSATGWLEHSTRAALTGLRRRGYELTLTRGERGGASVYRIAARNGEATK